MKVLIKFLYIISTLIVLFLLAGLFLPGSIDISTHIQIKASPEIIFDQINDLKNWKEWSRWINKNDLTDLTYGEKSVGIGGTCSWSESESKNGTMEIVNSIPSKEILLNMKYQNQDIAEISLKLNLSNDSTNVTYRYYNDHMLYFERYLMLLYQDLLKHEMYEGLKELKRISEELRLSRVSEVRMMAIESSHSLIIEDSAAVDEYPQKSAAMLERLMSYIDRYSITTTGDPFTVFYDRPGSGVRHFAVGIATEFRMRGYGTIKYHEIGEGDVAVITHWGIFNSPEPYHALDTYLEENNLELRDDPWVEYLNDPEEVSDTGNWQMDLFYPVH